MDIIYNRSDKYRVFEGLNYGDCFKISDDLFIKIPTINTKGQNLKGFYADEINCVNLKSGLVDYINKDSLVEIYSAKIIIDDILDDSI